MNLLASDMDHILAHTERLWEEFRDQRIFVTGGTGFFGCWLLESLAWANKKLRLHCSAVVLTRNPTVFRAKAPHLATNPGVQLQQGDISDFAFPQGSFSHLIHAASSLSQNNPEDPIGAIEKAFLGTRRVLELATQRAVKKLLFVSSGAVHGPSVCGRQRLQENEGVSGLPLEPRWSYAEGKRLGELLCVLQAQQHRFQAKIARGFAFLGPYLPIDAHFAAGNLIRDALQGGPLTVQGNGTAVRSYLYGADLAIWLWTILTKGKPSRPYNLGSDEAVSVADLAKEVASASDTSPRIRVLGRLSPGEVVDFYVPDVSRARTELGLRVWISRTDAIRRTLHWHKQLSSTRQQEDRRAAPNLASPATGLTPPRRARGYTSA